MIRALVVGAVLCAACNSDGASTDETLATPSPRPKKGSGGGFTASLSADLAKDRPGSGVRTAGTATGDPSSGSASGSGSNAGSVTAAAGSAAGAGSAQSGSATLSAAGSAKAGTPVAGAGSGSAKAPVAGAGSGSAKAPVAGAGSGSAKAAPPTPTPVAGAGSGSAKVAPPTPTPTPVAGAGSGSAAAPRPPVVLTPELKAIQLSMLPNWKRDDGEAATISLFVDVQSRGETAVFRFHYGYDDPRAPTDRDAYKKFLGDAKILSVAADRQRGAAWYLEGTDATGHPAFRILVTYGGKRLVCYGSLYKDSPFGDIRDEVIIQAKKICETIQL